MMLRHMSLPGHKIGPDRQILVIFCIFLAHAKNGPRWPQMGPGGFFYIFLSNPDLGDILGRTDFDFENFSPNNACVVGF